MLFLVLRLCIKIMADYSFSQYNFDNFDVHTDFLVVYKYATENDINESCKDSLYITRKFYTLFLGNLLLLLPPDVMRLILVV